MRKSIIAAVAAVAAITFSPLAHADGNIDEFNQYLLQHGIASDNVSTNNITYLQNGRNVCAAGPSNFEQWLLQHGMDRAGASDVAFAAHHYLCSGA
jgi:hypothetical protein